MHRPAAGIEHGAVFRRQAIGIENVLDGDGKAVQRPHRPPCLALAIEQARLIEGVIRIQVRPGLDIAIGLPDPVKASLDQFLGRDLAVAYFINRLGGGKFIDRKSVGRDRV